MDADLLPAPRGTWLVLQTDTGSVDVTSRARAVELLGVKGGSMWDEAVRSGGPHVVRVEPETVAADALIDAERQVAAYLLHAGIFPATRADTLAIRTLLDESRRLREVRS